MMAINRLLAACLLLQAGVSPAQEPVPVHPVPVAEAGTLTRVLDIRTLAPDVAETGVPVHVRAVVGFIESSGTVFIQDDTAGTHLRMPLRKGPRVAVGDRLEVRGKTFPGLYIPGIQEVELSITGHGPPPVAVPASYDDLAGGRYHYQRVVVEGLGRTLAPLDENRSVLRLALGARVIEVRVDAPLTSAPVIEDARLRITALAAGGINDRRQLVFPYLRVAGWEDVAVTEPARSVEELPVTPVANLLRYGTADQALHRVRVRGTVLAALPDGRLFVRDEKPEFKDEVPVVRALAIRLSEPAALEPGATVEAAGFPAMERFSAILVDARLLPPSAPPAPALVPEPVPLTSATLLQGRNDCDLVTLPAMIRDIYRTDQGLELRLDAGGQPFLAALDSVSTWPAVLAPGTRVQVTGICQVESNTDRGFQSRPDRARLLLRSLADVAVLQAPTWWTPRRLVIALGVLGGLVLLGVVWIGLLRRQLAAQAAALRAGIAQEAALQERQRIAREFHDTLEQELAGLTLRLDAALTRPLEDKARRLLDTSRQLVTRVQTEARNLVADLRSDPAATASLAEALADLAARHPTGTVPALELHVEEAGLPALPAGTVHHLRMIAQEGVTNALKHARAQRILISVKPEVSPARLVLEVEDDGHGLDPALTQGQAGHFGCMGIRERCLKIGAQVAWLRAPEHGTILQVTLPLELEG